MFPFSWLPWQSNRLTTVIWSLAFFFLLRHWFGSAYLDNTVPSQYYVYNPPECEAIS